MSKKVYFELSRCVRQCRTIVVEVSDDFDANDVDYNTVERIHEAYNGSGGDWSDDDEAEPTDLDGYMRDDAPGESEAVDVSLLDDDEDEEDT
jgi:hypothetical protein